MEKSIARSGRSGYVCQYCFAEIPRPVESIDPWQAACPDCFAFIIQTVDPLEQVFRAGALMAARESKRTGERVDIDSHDAGSSAKLILLANPFCKLAVIEK